MKEKLIVSASPHLRGQVTTKSIMLDVIIALMPSLIAAVIIFGTRVLMVVGVTVLSCVLCEYILRKIMKRDNTIADLSAVVTGMLLAFNLPVTINLWIAALGGAIAIVVVKQMFGGLGQNFVNPALIARIVLMVSFPKDMTTWVKPFERSYQDIDSITTATPLAMLKTSSLENVNYMDLFLGFRGGCLGETCILAIIIGGLYLVARKVISPTIPLCFIGTVFILSFAFSRDPILDLLSGGLMLGAVFMATDYVTSPITTKGKIIFGIGCGVLTILIRTFGALPEGVSFSIVVMNILVPHIEKLSTPKAFKRRESHEKV